MPVPLRLSLLSNSPTSLTGYGVQTRHLIKRLDAAGYPVAVQAFYGVEGAMLHMNGVSLYPRAHHPYGQDVMSAHALHFQADIMLSIMDAWVVQPENISPQVRWCPLYPVDCQPLPEIIRQKVAQSFQPIVMSRFGEQVSREAGLDVRYAPHVVECDVYKPMDQREARERLGIPQDVFVVGMVAANKGNPSRKAFTYQLEAFKRLHDAHPDTLLWLHTTKGANGENGGVNLPEFLAYLGLREGPDYRFTDQYQQVIGLGDAFMVTLYNAFDIKSMVSFGEGFGVPILEAQSCGIPVVTGDWTAMSEITFAGWKHPKEETEPWWFPLASYQFVPRVAVIHELYEQAYSARQNTKLWKKLKLKARAGALDYDADRVFARYWLPVLNELEERIYGAVRTPETPALVTVGERTEAAG